MPRFRWFILLLIPFLLFAVNRLGTTRLLGYHHFRQAHTSLAARNYAFHDANFLHPTIDGVTYEKDLYLNEFPLYPYLVGTLWRFLGEHLFIARLLSIVFTILALGYYHRLLSRYIADRLVVNLSLVAMSITPVVSYFGRCVERQSLFLFLLLMGTYWLLVYLDEKKKPALLPATLGLSLAILLNPFAVYMALPLGWYALKQTHARHWLDWRLYLVALLVVVPALAWYLYAAAVSRTLATADMLAIHEHRNLLSPAHYAMWLDFGNWERLFMNFVRFVTPSLPALLVFLYGVFESLREPGLGFFKMWLLAVSVYFLFDFYPVAVAVHQYYFMNIAPLTALFFAWGLVHLVRTGWPAVGRLVERNEEGWLVRINTPRLGLGWAKMVFVLLAAGGFAVAAVAYNREMHRDSWHADYYHHEEELVSRIPPGQRLTVVAETADPLFSYLFADRIKHRMMEYNASQFEEILARQDFDYLAILWDTPEFPVEKVVRAIDQAGYLGSPVLRTPSLLLFAKRGPARTSRTCFGEASVATRSALHGAIALPKTARQGLTLEAFVRQELPQRPHSMIKKEFDRD